MPAVPKLTSIDELSPAVREAALAAREARRIAKLGTGVAAFDAFNRWTGRYHSSGLKERAAMLDEGIALAGSRRSALREMIASDPQRALENAVPPVVRQQLPAGVVVRLEERVNETAFFGVYAALPLPGSLGARSIRREVRTDDGGVYNAFVFGRRETQQTTERSSVLGIAVDDALAVEARAVRVVAAGQIPNHPNNRTRRRTVQPRDDKGFVQESELRETPAPERPLVETCPVSGIVTAVSETPVAVTREQVVVEAGGQFHYLCSGGHIAGFEDEILLREGANGGPINPTNPPTPTTSTGYRRNLLIRVAFPETLNGLVTEQEGYDLSKSVQDWLLESSYGALTFATTVTPLIIMPRTEAWYVSRDTNGGATDVQIDARAAAKVAGFDTANFDFDAVIYNGAPGNFSGQAALAGKGCWLKSPSTGVACHEFGHNLGLWHANYWNTTTGSPIGVGVNNEYGDSYDTMGTANAGIHEFNVVNKWGLKWIADSVIHDVVSSGTYRIYQMDQPTQSPLLRYALKTRKDAQRNYWAEFRQKWTTSGQLNAIFLRWSPWSKSAGGSQLLDMTPGSMEGKADAPLVIGRTFSDLESGVHITPVAKNSTVPPSIDVVVNLGSFPANHAPTLAVSASTITVALNTPVTFTASAIDPDNDALSYAWELGDLRNTGQSTISVENLAVITNSWSIAGDYRVRCTVSDMKGGTASASVVIRVGTPGTFRISGVVTANGLPLANALIHNGPVGPTYRYAFTDSDGSYTLTGLAAGSYAVGTFFYDAVLTPSGNPAVTVGPDATLNFTANPLPRVSITALDADCSEGANTGTFRISRTGSPAGSLAVVAFGMRGTATSGTDYTLSPVATSSSPYVIYTIPGGQSYLDVVLSATADAAVEGSEIAILELASGNGYVLDSSVASFEIADGNSSLPLVRLIVTDRHGVESGDGAGVSIERLGSNANALDVGIAITGTATNGADYVAIPATVTFPPGIASVALNVAPLQDTLVESTEVVAIAIQPGIDYLRSALTAEQAASVYLSDDDAPLVTVAATDITSSEGGLDAGSFTITRTGDVSQPLVVNYGLSGAALHGTDYAALPGVLTIPAGSPVGTVSIAAINDSIGEPFQTVVLHLRSGIGYAVGGTGSATVTVVDDGDRPYVTLAAVTTPLKESGTTGVFRITSAGTGTGNITVNYTVSGTATNGTDYAMINGSVSMPRTGTTTVNIVPIQDTIVEGYESVTLTLTPDPAYGLALDNSATMNLEDDELPQVSVARTDSSRFEIVNNNLAFHLSRTGSTAAALTVNYTLGGSATAGLDYVAPSGSFTIPAGSASAYLAIGVLDDSLPEGSEVVEFTLAPSPAYSVGIGTAIAVIADSDSSGLAQQLDFVPATSTATENDGVLSIPVTLSSPATSTITVNFAINGGTALGAGLDYSFASGTLTFAPGITTQNIPLTIINDTLDEGDETVSVGIFEAFGARIGAGTHTITITDNDNPPTAILGFAAATSSVSETQSTAPLAVALGPVQTSAVTVNYSVIGGTATNGSDYTLSAGTLTFPPGETMMLIPFSIINDTAIESSETVIVRINNAVGAGIGTSSTHTLTITDDDTVSINIAATDTTASEPGTDGGVFTITRSGSTAAAVTVNLSRSGSATSGTDFTAIATTVVIPQGQTFAAVAVTPLDDLFREGNETVTLGIAAGSYIVGSPSSATITIVDNEPVLSITATTPTVTENGAPGEFTITRVGSTVGALTVNATITGTATSGVDFTAPTLPVIIPDGAATAVVSIATLDDLIPEPSETVVVTLNAGAYGISGLNSATVTIADDEPFVSVAATTANAAEPATAGAFTITRTGSTTAAIDVNVTITGTATAGADYTAIGSVVMIPAAQTSVLVPVAVLDDIAQEGYENVTLTIGPGAAYTLGGVVNATVTIRDDDINNPPIISMVLPVKNSVGIPSIAVGLMLEASVEDDGAPSPLTTTWSTLSAPNAATVTFENANAATTGVRFSATGAYVLRLTASDGLLQTTYDQRVVVAPAYTAQLSGGDLGTFANGSATGSHTFSGGSYTLSGSGSSIGSDNTDGFYFLRQTSTGNTLDVVARVTSITGNNGVASRAGIMVRTGVGNADVEAFIGVTANGRVAWVTRSIQGNNATELTSNNLAAPRWIRMVRSDQQFTGYHSADGITWTSMGNSGFLNTTTSMLVGLAVTDAGTGLAIASFSNVSMSFADNNGPTVSAGPDRAVRVGETITLAGTRSDDAKPVVPGLVTVAWSKLSGPNPLTIAVPSAAATTAIAGAPGAFVLRLTANDGEAKTYDDMVATITQETVEAFVIAGYENANEAGQVEASFAFTRTTGTGTLAVYFTAGGTATQGVDYPTLPPGGAFYPGDVEAYGGIIPTLDSIVEGTETVSLTLTPGPGYVIGQNNTASVNILDAPVVTIAATVPTASELGSAGTFTVSRSGSTGAPLTVLIAASGSATSGSDYAALPASIIIPAAAASVTIDVVPIGDALIEADESVIVTIQPGTLYGASPVAATVLITDAPTVTVVAISGASENGPIAGGFLISRVGPTDSPLTVLVATSGSAASGSDYAAVASSVTIQTGETSAVLPITPLPDSLSEGPETVTLTALPSANYFRGAPSADTITLDDRFIDAWRFSKFGADANDPLIAGDLADPDADGLANLQEYAFNLDPLATSEGPVFSLDNTTLSLTYRRHLLATDIALTLEEASTVSTWTPAAPSVQILSDDTITRLIRATVPRSGEQQFLRVRVERQ